MFESLRAGMHKIIDGVTRDFDSLRFDFKADALSARYLRGEISNEDLAAEAQRFPGRDLAAEVERISLDTQIRNDPSHFYPIDIPREGH